MASFSNLSPATLTWPQKTQFQSYDGMKFNASEANGIPVAINNHAAILTLLLTQQQPPTVVEFNPQAAGGYFGPNANGTGASQVFYIQNGVTDYYTARQRLRLPDFPSGLPAPTTGGADDPYWALASPPAAEYQPLQEVTVRQMQDVLIPQAGLRPGRFYRLKRYLPAEDDGGLGQAPPPAEFDVVVLALTTTDYAPKAWAIDNTTSAVLAEGSYDLATDTFTAATEGLTPAQLLRLPVATPTSPILWVQAGGQTEAGQKGAYSFSRPFPTLAAAHAAASAGDRIVVLPGTYAETTVVTKSVQVICLPGVVFTGVINAGNFGGSTPFDITWYGGEFAGTSTIAVLKQFGGASTFSWYEGRLSGQAYIYCLGSGADGNYLDEILLVGLRARTSIAEVGGFSPVSVGGRTDFNQQQRVILDDCVIEAINGEPLRWAAHPASRVVLRGSTRLESPSGTAQSLTLPLVPSGQQFTESDWLIDERAGADTTVDFQAEHNGTTGFSDLKISGPATVTAVTDAYNATVWRWQLLSAAGAALGPVRATVADCAADLAAAWASNPAFVVVRHEVVPTQATDTASFTFSYQLL